MKSNKFSVRLFQIFILAVAIIAVYKMFDKIGSVFAAIGSFLALFTPFVIAFVIAYFLYPLCKKVTVLIGKIPLKWIRKHSYGVSVGIVYLCFIVIVSVGFFFLIPFVYKSIVDLMSNVPKYAMNIYDQCNRLASQYNLDKYIDWPAIQSYISPKNITSLLNMNNMNIFIKGFVGFTSTVFSFIMGLVIGIYVLLEKDRLIGVAGKLLRLFVKEEKISVIRSYIKKMSDIMYNFFIGKVLDSLLNALISYLVFYFMGVPYAFLMGVIVGIFNMIPYFGAFIGAAPVILVSLLTNGLSQGIAVSIAILIIQQFDGLFLGPKILGQSVGISPFWTMVALLIGGGLFGIWGMILGVPVIAVIKMFFEHFYERKRYKRKVQMMSESMIE